MDRLRQFCAVVVLTFVLSFSAFAGEMATGAVSEPPSEQTSVTGEMATGCVDPVTEFGLTILQSLLSLF